MRRVISGALIAVGVATLTWVAYSVMRAPQPPFQVTMSPAPSGALPDFFPAGVERGELDRVEVRTSQEINPVATAIVTRDSDGRLTPLSWSNAVTEPVLFPELESQIVSKILAAIREHVPSDAVVLSWWDLSRRIRIVAQRHAPLDDPLARGLLIPAAWSGSADHVQQSQRRLWGTRSPEGDGGGFAKFIDALLLDEVRGVKAFAEIAGGKPAFVAVHLSDIWKVAAAEPDRISIEYRDFAGAIGSHDVMKAARQWLQEEKIEGGYAVEPRGAAIRLHYFRRKSDCEFLIAKLLPFSTSNPLRLDRLQLVYQFKGYWIYKLNASNS